MLRQVMLRGVEMNNKNMSDKSILHAKVAESLKQVQREQHLKTLLDNFPFMVWLKDKDSRLLVANATYAKMAGVSSPDELEGKTDFDIFPQELAEQYVEGDREAMKSDVPIGTVCPIRDANGQFYWIESYKSALVINNQVVGSVGYARDVTESLKNEREYHSIIDNSPSSIVRYDHANKRIFTNPKMAEFYEVAPEFLLGKTPSEFPGGKSAESFERSIQAVFSDGKNRTVDLSWQLQSGEQRIIRSTLAAELDPEGNIIAVISMGQDVSESVKYQEHIHRLAFYDPLTNLPNRAKFSDYLEKAASEAKLNGHQFGLINIDIDRFKEINDSIGHAVGDELLQAVANRLTALIGEHDVLARIGVNEFAILLTNIEGSEHLATTVDKVKQTQLEPYLISGKRIFITFCMGIALYPSDSNKVDELFKFAVSALYCAKRLGRSNIKFYTKELTLRATDRMSLENALRNALANNEFELHYQPQANIETNQVIGVEALIRWNRDHKEMIPPDSFISIAEDTGLIIEIGEWIFKTACLSAVELNANRLTPLQVAINLSPRQFIRNNIVGSIQNILKDTHCKPEWIKLEITESLLLEKEDDIKQIMHQLNDIGLQISLDDFGTGYSALGYLIHFPVNQLKIDRSFINDITTNDDRRLLVKAIISMATSLRMDIIAEGVETIEQANYLRQSGCIYAQGYLYGKPMRFEELIKTLKP
jgi:diguanylate cyclase (GGDEF)-like protein/PAS domain S-box-containing protein